MSKGKRFTAQQQAAILRLYVQQRVPGRVTAERLGLSISRVFEFLHDRGVMRPRGYHVEKLAPAELKQLKRRLLTTQDSVLAQRYGLSRERVRQIRQQMGYPSSQMLRHKVALRAQAKREAKERRDRELRERQRRARRLLVINKLSKFWKSGLRIWELANEYGITPAAFSERIAGARKLYPEKFPYRWRRRPPPPKARTH